MRVPDWAAVLFQVSVAGQDGGSANRRHGLRL